MNAYDAHAASLAQVQDEMGEAVPKFKWKNKFWAIVADNSEYLKRLEIGGYILNSRVVMTVLTDQFLPSTPEQIKDQMIETTMFYKNVSWIIKKVDITGRQFQIEAHQVTA